MRKAINTGIITGLILTIIMILGTMCRILFPATTTIANITFIIIFVSAITMTLWIALSQYSRSAIGSWSNLSLISTITSATTAILFSTASLIYTRYFSTGYLSDLMDPSKQNWFQRNYSTQSLASQAPWNFAFNNLQVMLVVLFVISLFITFVYYSVNRNKIPLHENHHNQELIF
jgi:hypothetical protein